jgi:N6-L-threonylcarbamoyladenine synthase
VDVLEARARAAIVREGLTRFAIGGGVAANSEWRARAQQLDAELWIPDMALCTDNAAMIAGASRFAQPLAYPDYLDLDASARPVA